MLQRVETPVKDVTWRMFIEICNSLCSSPSFPRNRNERTPIFLGTIGETGNNASNNEEESSRIINSQTISTFNLENDRSIVQKGTKYGVWVEMMILGTQRSRNSPRINTITTVGNVASLPFQWTHVNNRGKVEGKEEARKADRERGRTKMFRKVRL